MAQQCECNVVGSFGKPEYNWEDLGFISITLRTNTPVIVTSDGLKLTGATTGELAVSGYGSLNGYPFQCPGRAGASYDWMQKYNCLSEQMFYIPRGGAKSFVEGDIGVGVTIDIDIDGVVKYESIQASATGGPGSIYLRAEQTDGFNFRYYGGPIQVYDRVINVIQEGGRFVDIPRERGNLSGNQYGILASLLPRGSELYLMNFSWEQTPPDIPTVSYTFAFTNANYELLIDEVREITCPDGSTSSIPSRATRRV